MTAYIYDGLRSPFGRHAGALAPVRPDDLLAEVIRAVVARNPFTGHVVCADYAALVMWDYALPCFSSPDLLATDD